MSLLIKKHARLPVVGMSVRPRAVRGIRLPLRGGTGTRAADMVSPEMERMVQLIGERRAQEIKKLKDKGIVGTLPELCTYAWLDGRGYRFDFQSAMLGGRYTHGGAVVDFRIADISRIGWYIWRIQGEFWHEGLDMEARDTSQKARLRAAVIEGVPVVEVVDLWEADIYGHFPEVYELAEAGVEMGG